MRHGYVRRLDSDSLRQVVSGLKPGEYLWLAEYPCSQKLTSEPLPREWPSAGRIIAPDLELRFFDEGRRGVLLQEREFETVMPDDQTFTVELQTLPVSGCDHASGRDDLRGWRLLVVEYGDPATGEMRWTRWCAVKTSDDRGEAQNA